MLGKGDPVGQQGIFGNDLATMLDPNHPLYRLAQVVPWQEFEGDFAPLYSANRGRPSKPIRLMTGLVILKHLCNTSDEDLVANWVQNPYWQFFCGATHFQWRFPCDPSELTRFRKRIGEDGCERILAASLRIQEDRIDTSGDVVIDSTAQEKNITYPTFAKLDCKVIERCRSIAAKEGIVLRQSYVRTLPGLRVQARHHRHKNPKVRRKARRAERKIRTIARRLLREIQRKLPAHRLRRYAEDLRRMGIAIRQTAEPGTDRIHSLHEPEVVCIAKGKAHKTYEFGCKVSIAMDPRSGLVVAAHKMPGKQHDRHSVPETLRQIERLTGKTPKRVIADQGYRGQRFEGDTEIITPIDVRKATGSTRKRLRRAMRRRQLIEATIGRMKILHRMGRNFLKGDIGDRLNVILAAAAHNFRAWLRALFVFILSFIEEQIFATRALIRPAAGRSRHCLYTT